MFDVLPTRRYHRADSGGHGKIPLPTAPSIHTGCNYINFIKLFINLLIHVG
jgi:hypothetical protein